MMDHRIRRLARRGCWPLLALLLGACESPVGPFQVHLGTLSDEAFSLPENPWFERVGERSILVEVWTVFGGLCDGIGEVTTVERRGTVATVTPYDYWTRCGPERNAIHRHHEATIDFDRREIVTVRVRVLDRVDPVGFDTVTFERSFDLRVPFTPGSPP